MTLLEKVLIRDTTNYSLSIINESSDYKSNNPAVLVTLYGALLDYGEPSRNDGRLYTESLCDKIVNSVYFNELKDNNAIIGEPNHPAKWEDRDEVDYSKASHAVRDITKDPDTKKYYGYIDILDTVNGRTLYTLVKYGTKLAISSRGLGSINVSSDGNKYVDEDTYVFITFDIVHVPGIKSARLSELPSGKDVGVINSDDMYNQISESINTAISKNDTKVINSLRNVVTYMSEYMVNDNNSDIIKSMSELLNPGSITDSHDDKTTMSVEDNISDDLIIAYKDISQLKSDNESLNNEIAKLLSINSNLLSEISNLSLDNTSYKSMISDKETIISALLNDIKSLESSSVVNENKVKNMISQLDYQSTVIDNKQLEINHLHNSISQLKSDYDVLLKTYNSLLLKNNSLSKSYDELKDDIYLSNESLDKANEEYKSKLSVYESKVSNLSKELNSYKDKSSKLSESYNRSITENKKLQSNYESLISDANYEISKLDNINRQLLVEYYKLKCSSVGVRYDDKLIESLLDTSRSFESVSEINQYVSDTFLSITPSFSKSNDKKVIEGNIYHPDNSDNEKVNELKLLTNTVKLVK